MEKWIYEIFLNDVLVGDSVEDIFPSRADAVLDAESFIEDLSAEYGAVPKDFELVLYTNDPSKNLGFLDAYFPV